jgi:hypothetical protein
MIKLLRNARLFTVLSKQSPAASRRQQGRNAHQQRLGKNGGERPAYVALTYDNPLPVPFPAPEDDSESEDG